MNRAGSYHNNQLVLILSRDHISDCLVAFLDQLFRKIAQLDLTLHLDMHDKIFILQEGKIVSINRAITLLYI